MLTVYRSTLFHPIIADKSKSFEEISFFHNFIKGIFLNLLEDLLRPGTSL